MRVAIEVGGMRWFVVLIHRWWGADKVIFPGVGQAAAAGTIGRKRDGSNSLEGSRVGDMFGDAVCVPIRKRRRRVWEYSMRVENSGDVVRFLIWDGMRFGAEIRVV
ncbi:MAG: hypothetical protein ACLU4J_09595 [Butyricimonas paravirosa]